MPQAWGGSSSSGSPFGSNQFMSYSNMNPNQNSNVGIVPSQSNFSPQAFNAVDPWGYGTGGANQLSGGMNTVPTNSPQFTQQWYQYLTSQLGQGLSPFDLSAIMPSTGQATQPGQLTPGLTPTLQDLQSFLSGGGSSMPGLNQLGQMAQTGDPISVTPEWQAMIAAQQNNIEAQQANLKEQFGFAGDLSSSPFGDSMAMFQSQTTRDQNALLGQLTQQSLESAAGRQLTAGQDISQMGMQLGDLFQNLDQNAITALYNEFTRTQPQNNPMLSFMGQGAMASPQTYQPAQSSILGDIGSFLGPLLGAGGLGGNIKSLAGLFGQKVPGGNSGG